MPPNSIDVLQRCAACDLHESAPGLGLAARQHFDLLGNVFDAFIETSQSPLRSSTILIMRGDNTSMRSGQNLRELLTQKAKSLAHSNAALQEEATDLVITAVRWPTKRDRTRCSAWRSN